VSDASPAQQLHALQQENAQLRKELAKRQKADDRAAKRRQRVLKEGGKFLLPLMDRKRVVRTFLELFETVSRFSEPREEWPNKEEIIDSSRKFALASLRFAIRRRLLMFLISLFALAVPGLQIYLVFKQNQIIENQNKYFRAEVYDIVARSLTSGDLNSKTLTGALLAATDIELVSGIVKQVFDDTGVQFLEEESNLTRHLRDAAVRGYLIFAVTRVVEEAKGYSAEELFAQTNESLRMVVNDAVHRVPEILRASDTATMDDELTEEVARYLFNIGRLMKKTWSLAIATDAEARFYATITPLIARTSRLRGINLEDKPFARVFFTNALQELLVDLALEPEFGKPLPPIPSDIEPVLEEGFKRLKRGVGEGRGVNWTALKRRADIP
jgi:hypothetical protein